MALELMSLGGNTSITVDERNRYSWSSEEIVRFLEQVDIEDIGEAVSESTLCLRQQIIQGALAATFVIHFCWTDFVINVD